MARDLGGRGPLFQLLIYPVTDYLPGTPSSEENAHGYFLTREDMVWFWNHYLNSESPLKFGINSCSSCGDTSQTLRYMSIQPLHGGKADHRILEHAHDGLTHHFALRIEHRTPLVSCAKFVPTTFRNLIKNAAKKHNEAQGALSNLFSRQLLHSTDFELISSS